MQVPVISKTFKGAFMKSYFGKFATALVLSLTVVSGGTRCQSVEVQSIAVTMNKTSSLVFPTVIKSVDRGSRDVLAQKAKGVENVLQVKAARPGFPETNLTVITADGQIHEFAVRYAASPGTLVVQVDGPEGGVVGQGLIFQTDVTESDLQAYASRVAGARKSVRFKARRKFKMKLALHGIYIRDNVIFYHVQIVNRSHIGYDVEYLRFYIKDRTKAKRTASQEVSVVPLYVYGGLGSIAGSSATQVVFALEKFTIPDAKRLTVEMYEKNGGRDLTLRLKNRRIVKARLLP